MADAASHEKVEVYLPSGSVLGIRFLAWTVVTTLGVFLLNAYLKFWLGWPGVTAAFSGGGALAWLHVLFYLAAVAGPAVLVVKT